MQKINLMPQISLKEKEFIKPTPNSFDDVKDDEDGDRKHKSKA